MALVPLHATLKMIDVVGVQMAPFRLLALLMATVRTTWVALPCEAATTNLSHLNSEHHDAKGVGFGERRGRQLQVACPAGGVLPQQRLKIVTEEVELPCLGL
jgi:hypothetical protein